MIPYYIAISVIMITTGLLLSRYELKRGRDKRRAALKARARPRSGK